MATTALVPAVLPAAINGRPYLIDADYQRTTLDVIRTQSDAGDAPGEHSLSPYGLWPRSRETFHHGAGQRFCDGKNSDEARYRSSKGIDPWTEGQATLLNQTVLRRASANTNLAALVVGSEYVYVADGTQVYHNASSFNGLLNDNQASFETNTAGWTAGNANTTIARTTAQFYAGAASLSLTGTASGATSAITTTGTGGFRVTPLGRYIVQIATRPGATARTVEARMHWYNAAGAEIGTYDLAFSGHTETAATWTLASNDAVLVAPPLAVTAALEYVVPTSAAGEVHYIDAVHIASGSTVRGTPYWISADIQAGEAAQTVASITSNGYHVWAALGSSGIHRTTAGATSSTANVPAGTFNLVGYAAPYLLAANANILYEIRDPLGTPEAVAFASPGTHPNANFAWSLIAKGRNCLYVGGNSGGNAELYRIGIDAATGALGALTPCSQLPDGETIHALYFYAGAAVLGTSKGVRVAIADGQGNLDYGPLIQTPNPVRCLEPQDRFCWFGMTNYDTSSTGLGRVDLGAFTDNLVPAWASDLMAIPVPPATTVQGDVLSVVTLNPFSFSTLTPLAQRFFAVSGVGFFGEDIGTYIASTASADGIKVASGTLETGNARYATSERKNIRLLDLRHHALDGTISAEAKYDDVAYASVGSSSTQGSSGPASPLTVDQTGESSEVRFTLARATNGRHVNAVNVTAGSTTVTADPPGAFSAADVGMPVSLYHHTTNVGLSARARVLSFTDSSNIVLSEAVPATASLARLVFGSPTRAPELVRWTTKALPLPKAPETFTVTIHMKASVLTTAGNGQGYPMDVPTEVAAIKALEQARTVVDFQLGEDTFSVYVVKSQFQGEHWNGPRREYAEGKMQVQLQTVQW